MHSEQTHPKTPHPPFSSIQGESSEDWTGKELQVRMEKAWKGERRNTLSLPENGEVHGTHSFLTAWCMSVHPWGSSSGPWGRPESAWSWGEKTTKGSDVQFVVLMREWTLSDAKCCIQAGNLSGVMEGMTDYSLLSCLCFHTCCWKASEMPRIWVCEIIPGRDWWNGRCCFTVMLSWTVQKSVLPHQSFAASAFISCLRLTTVWISSEPKPVLWTQHTFLATDAVWKSLNRTFLYQNKPRTLVKTADFCGRNERCECKFLQGKCPLQLTVTVPFWIPTVPLESSSFTFPLGAGCISHGKLWCCAVLQSTFKMFAYFNKLLWNDVDVIHINTSWTFVIWFDNMPFPRFRFRLILIFRCINAFQTFRFFSYLPRCRNSRIFGR